MKRLRFFLSGISLLAAVLSLSFCSRASMSRNQASNVSITNDVGYESESGGRNRLMGVKTEDEDHQLDIYAPPNARNAPVVVFIHGGGWSMGRKSWKACKTLGERLADRGYVTVVPNYRRSGTAKFPASIKDVAASFAWTYNNIGRYGGDPNKIFVSGHSAGGHLATLLVLDPRYLKEVNVPPSAVKGVLALSGIYDIGKMDAKFLAKDEFGKDQNVWKEASPIQYVRPGLPPFLVLNAQRDPGGLKKQAAELVDALRKDGNRVDVVLLEHQSHSGEIMGKDTAVVPPMVEFINSTLQSQVPVPAGEKAAPAGPSPSTP